MPPRSLLLFPLLLMIFTAGCASLNLNRAQEADAQRAAEYLTGCFDSLDQAQADPDSYYRIRLILVPIWPHLTSGHWLYVEQASFDSLERPYRQRIQHVYLDENSQIRSDVYLLPGNPQEFAGAWETPGDSFANLSPRLLTLRDGCSVILDPDGSGFTGSTIAEECQSTLGGAAYATSEVELYEGLLVSWDRGWNSDGDQVWGATDGGYRFVRRGSLPEESDDE